MFYVKIILLLTCYEQQACMIHNSQDLFLIQITTSCQSINIWSISSCFALVLILLFFFNITL